jgi:predicted nucleic acid-binding protein
LEEHGMRALLDTNILIHREAAVVVRHNIGLVFKWLDQLHYEKCIHPVSIEEIEQHKDDRVRRSFAIKIASYHVLKSLAAICPEIQTLIDTLDATTNDRNDSKILNELFAGRVDLLITEDRGVFRKAEKLNIADRVFTIDAFLEKVVAENPDLLEYKVLSVRKNLFGEIDLANHFFDSFREDYPGFDRWFNRKGDDPAYICFEGFSAGHFYKPFSDR